MFSADILTTVLASLEPNYLVTALVLAGLAIVLVLQNRHFNRMNKLAKEMRSLVSLREEVASLRGTFEKINIDPLMQLLDEVREKGIRLENRLESHLSTPVEVGQGEVYDLDQEINRRLKQKGFISIRIRQEDENAAHDTSGEFRLRFEAYKDGVAHKGHMIIRDGRVVSEQIKPAYEAFP